MAAPAPPLFTFNDGSILRSGPARALLRYPVWEGNRVMDETHVDTLDLATPDPKQLQGPYSIVEYPNTETGVSERRVIDGQHRRAVLERYFARNPTAPEFQILVRLYRVDSYDDIKPLFCKINLAKPMVYKGSSTEQLHAIVTALRKAFVSDRGHLIRPNTHRPYLNQEQLEYALKLYRIHERTDITPAAIVAHAEHMNGWFAEDHGRIQCASAPTRAMLDRATEIGFFLGLDSRCSWLISLKA